MDRAAFRVSIDRFAARDDPWREPIALVDLASTDGQCDDLVLPPCPVIGVGAATHPLATKLDAVIESPVTLDAVVNAILSQPLAASVFVQLLRNLDGASLATGLVMESMAYALLQGSAAHRSWIEARVRQDCVAPEGRVILAREEAEAGDRLIVTMSRPDAGNAIDRKMRDELREAFQLANADPTLARITLRATGKAFSLGADLDEFGTTTDPATAHAIRMQTLPALEAWRCADRLDVQVDGACVGAGLELAGFARHITATARSWFQLPELAMGIIPGAGGCVSISNRIGRQRTALMVLGGRRLSARQALDWGLIDAIVDELP